tara:strand:+ start:42225 stop:42548 length:324 start_codon:yes stop_codon:yes gene_type:complete
MRVFNLRITDTQYQNAKLLADNDNAKISKILRDAITLGLQTKTHQSPSSSQEKGVPKYEILATSASIETLILLRKIAKTTSPELVEAATSEAKERLQQEDLMEIIKH